MKNVFAVLFIALLGVSALGCDNDTATSSDCTQGELKLGPVACGLNDRGVLLDECVQGAWEATETCYDTDECTDDATRTGYTSCGLNDRGLMVQRCTEGTWEDTTACLASDQCTDGETRPGSTPCGFNGNGSWEQVCTGGQWMDSPVCEDDEVCTDGVQEVGETACGYNGAGTLIRECTGGQWADTATCLDPDTCVEGVRRVDPALLTCGLSDEGYLMDECIEGDQEVTTLCQGDFQATSWGTAAEDRVTDICSDGQQALYVVGYTLGTFSGEASAGNNDAFLTKLTDDGSVLWTRQWGTGGDDQGRSVVVDSAGDILVAGHTNGAFPGQTNVGGEDLFLSRFTADGSLQWTLQWGTVGNDSAVKMSIDGADNLFIAGTTGGTFTGPDAQGVGYAFLEKCTTDGSILWTRQWGGGIPAFPEGAALDSQSNVYVVGITSGAFPGYTLAGITDLFLSKITTDGSVLWTRQWGSESREKSARVAVNPNNEVYLTAYSLDVFPEQTTPYAPLLVMRVTTDGTMVWAEEYGLIDEWPQMDSIVATDQEIYVAGTNDYDGGVNGFNVEQFLLKVGTDGTLHDYITRKDGTNDEQYHALHISPEGVLYVAGATNKYFMGEITRGWDLFLLWGLW